MTMRTIGIDPGLDGALCLSDTSTGQLAIIDMPTVTVQVGRGAKAKNRRKVDPHTLLEWLAMVGRVDVVVLESQQPRPGEGAQGAFTMGVGWGILYGQLVALCRPLQIITPQTWTKRLGAGPDKGQHRRMAMDLFPAHAHQFRLVKHDGRADAALMAHWATLDRG